MNGRPKTMVWPLLLAALLAGSFILRVVDLDSDAPLDVSRDLSLTIDGSWYVGASLDWASDRTAGVGHAYDPPVFGIIARAIFVIFGPTRWAANLLSVLFGLVAIGFTAAAARRSHGLTAALLAGGLLSLSYPFFIYSRAPGIYVPLSALGAIMLYCHARAVAEGGNRRLGMFICGGVVILGVVGFKPAFMLNGLALALTLGMSLGRLQGMTRTKVFGGIVAIVPAALIGLWASGLVDGIMHRLVEYLHVGGGPKAIPGRILTLESRLGAMTAAPVLMLLAALGTPFLRPGKSEHLAIWMIAVHAGLLAVLGYSPLRYFLPTFPALALLASRTLVHLGEARSLEHFETGRTLMARRALRGLLLGYISLQALQAIGLTSLAILLPMAIVFGAALEVMCGGHFSGRATRFGMVTALVCLGGFACFNLPRSAVALATADDSIARAGVELEAILEPTAHLTGPFAHVLTYESSHRRSYTPRLWFGKGRLARQLRQGCFTHFALDVNDSTRGILSAFESDGAPLSFVHEFFLRGQKVHLYRFPWAEEITPLTDFERGILALQNGDVQQATHHLERARTLTPRSSAVCSALGAMNLEQGRSAPALSLLQEALVLNPYEATAMRSLLRIYLERGDLERARPVLVRLVQLDPGDQEALSLLERLR